MKTSIAIIREATIPWYGDDPFMDPSFHQFDPVSSLKNYIFPTASGHDIFDYEGYPHFENIEEDGHTLRGSMLVTWFFTDPSSSKPPVISPSELRSTVETLLVEQFRSFLKRPLAQRIERTARSVFQLYEVEVYSSRKGRGFPGPSIPYIEIESKVSFHIESVRITSR